jgi:hypothetical protein
MIPGGLDGWIVLVVGADIHAIERLGDGRFVLGC